MNEEETGAQTVEVARVPPKITYTNFNNESELKAIQGLIDKELSEPYSIYTYRYFVYNWPELCIFARHDELYVGVVVCKLETLGCILQGYIAMLAVDPAYRLLKIGTSLVAQAVESMQSVNADEIVLETELTNKAALRLYESLGFIREKRLLRYYMNGVDALRLKLFLPWRQA
ncbi:N-alpha-acetyltransferase 30A [Drosophila hydei]|uniref:N-alpha-acetyltransferase 30A n=1 Tax=Drosophila hydei TaxID=7224 RepID=A0A6J1L874_DROHY|nr:N-alpha-acetyltransferase 30A [Drosophila hydei]